MPLIFNEVWIRSQALTRLEHGQLHIVRALTFKLSMIVDSKGLVPG